MKSISCFLFGHHYTPTSTTDKRDTNATGEKNTFTVVRITCIKCGDTVINKETA